MGSRTHAARGFCQSKPVVEYNRTKEKLDRPLDPASVYRNIVCHYGEAAGVSAQVNGLCVHSLRATAATNALAVTLQIMWRAVQLPGARAALNSSRAMAWAAEEPHRRARHSMTVVGGKLGLLRQIACKVLRQVACKMTPLDLVFAITYGTTSPAIARLLGNSLLLIPEQRLFRVLRGNGYDGIF